MNASASIDFKGLFLKNRDTVVIGVVIAVAFFVSKNVYQKQMSKYETLKAQIKAEADKGASLEIIVGLNEKIKKLKMKSWETQDTDAIVDAIYAIAHQSQIKIRDVNQQEKRDTKYYVAIPFAISFETTYKGLYLFMKKLETYSKLLRVLSVTAAPVGGPVAAHDEGPLLRITAALEATYMK